MNHETAIPLIGDLLHGRLSGKIRGEVLSHVTSCTECKSLSETYAVLSEAWHDDTLEHPPSELIVQYAIAEDSLDEEVRAKVSAHLLKCELCASEVDVTSNAEAELAAVESPPSEQPGEMRDRRWLLAPAITAAAVLVILAYPAYLGLFEVPRIKSRLSVLEAEGTADTTAKWTGLAEPLYLQSPLRGVDTELPTIELASGQPYISLAVVPGMLEEYAGAQSIRFEIRDADGQSTWSWALSESELRSRADGDVVWFMVPGSALPAGRLTLSVSREPGSGVPVFEAPFLVRRSD
jgi:hypothetical protein